MSSDKDGSGALANKFDKEQIETSFEIMQTLQREVGTFVGNRAKEADDLKKARDKETDPAKRAELDAQLADALKWGPGGDYRRIATAIVAAAAGNVTAGMGDMITRGAVNYLQSLGAEKVKAIADELNSETARAALQGIVGCAGAAASGGNCGAGAMGASASVVLNNLLDKAGGKSGKDLSAEAKEAHSNLVTSVVAGIAAVSGGNATTAATGAKIEVENNYLNEKEARDLDREFSSCKTSGGNCKEVIEKYVDISNKNSKELAEACTGGGVACVTWEEIIRASTSVAIDENGFQVRMSEKLKDAGASALLEYLNGKDLKFLKENISTADRVLSVVSDPTSWPAIVMSAKSFITGASGKEKLIAAGITSGASAAIQYGIDKNVSLADLIGAAAIGSITAGKSYNTTVTWNAVGGYYSAEIKGDDPFMTGLLSKAGSSVGYSSGNVIKIPMDKIMNKASKQYEWVPTGVWTITKPAPQSILPSVSGNIADSAASSLFNFNIENGLKNNDNYNEKK